MGTWWPVLPKLSGREVLMLEAEGQPGSERDAAIMSASLLRWGTWKGLRENLPSSFSP